MLSFKRYLNGIIFTAIITVIAYIVAKLPFPPFTVHINQHPIEAMSAGLVLGIIIANCVKLPDFLKPGISFTQHTILALGIVLLGFKLNLHSLLSLPWLVPITIIITSLCTLISALLIGRLLKCSTDTALFVGTGNAICGSSAIMATSKALPHLCKEKAAVSIATVNVIGLILIFVLPVIGHSLHLSDLQMGLWAGATGQAVPQAIAIGFTYSHGAGLYATTIKLARVLQLGVYVLVMKLLNRHHMPSTGKIKTRYYQTILKFIPGFILLFIIALCINSFVHMPMVSMPSGTQLPLNNVLGKISAFLLSMALTSIGLNTRISSLIKQGSSSFVIGAISAITAVLVSLGGCLLL